MENRQNMYDKGFTCPVCDGEFTSKAVKTTSKRIAKQDSDFFLHYTSTTNPYYYEIIICPKCGYASSTGYFDQISDSQVDIIKGKISIHWAEKNFGNERSIDAALSCFKLALHEGTLINITNLRMGKLCLKIAWLYRIKADNEKENEFLKYALDYFYKSYSYDRLPQDDFDIYDCTYLIGELSHRLENYEEALKWFNLTLKIKEISPKINNLTREQWFIVKEKYAKLSQKSEVI